MVKNCFLWSLSARNYPCKNDHPNRVSYYRQFFNELSLEGFDYSNRFRCTDVHIFEKINSLSIKITNLIFLIRSKQLES